MHGDVAVCLSWRGRRSDSPRVISGELARRGTGVRQVWVLDDEVLLDVEAATAPYRSGTPPGWPRYCPWVDGGASARIVDAVFGPAAPGHALRTAVTDKEAARA